MSPSKEMKQKVVTAVLLAVGRRFLKQSMLLLSIVAVMFIWFGYVSLTQHANLENTLKRPNEYFVIRSTTHSQADGHTFPFCRFNSEMINSQMVSIAKTLCKEKGAASIFDTIWITIGASNIGKGSFIYFSISEYLGELIEPPNGSIQFPVRGIDFFSMRNTRTWSAHRVFCIDYGCCRSLGIRLKVGP